MEYYLATLAFPALIIVIHFFVFKIKLEHFSDLISILFRSLPFLFAYTFLLYFLSMENYLDTGWAFYSLLFFLIPISLILAILKLFKIIN